jgi:thimet oligopeptidase
MCILAGISLQATAAGISLPEFEKRASKFNALVALPRFETNSAQVEGSVRKTMEEGNAALDKIGAVQPGKASFANTSLALDDALYNIMLSANRVGLLKETSASAEVREAATEGLKKIEEWAVGLEYREDVYKALKGFADSMPRLKELEARLLREQMRDFKRAGLALPEKERAHVEKLRKELAALSTDFTSNVTKAEKALKFTRAELEGVPPTFLEQVKTGDDEFTVMANVTYHFVTVMENANSEATRKRLQIERNNLAREQNVPLLEKIVALRADIAQALGYKTWGDFQTETRMAKNAQAAIDFLERLKKGLEPKYKAELEQFRAMKARQTGDPKAEVFIWDWRYFSNQLKKEKYSIDAEQLRVYFPMEPTLKGMFDVYQKIFGLKFEQVEPPDQWAEGLQLWAVSDAKTGEPMGMFYLDLFPREGKYNHFACFGIVDGKRLRDGKYHRPVVALVCNFPAPTASAPSLLSHNEVETLFHEFGHAMHGILTRVDFVKFSGLNVPRDFVEAPSQMLEHWVWDKKVLDSFAADYRDPSKKIPAEIIGKLWEARMATEANRYRRQISFGLTDLALHTRITRANAEEVLPLSNEMLSSAFLKRPDDTAFVAFWGHLMGYDAGYYGYAWADAIAADMGTVFKKARGGLMDETAGRKLRDEIYAQGYARDVDVSVRKFLGRETSLKPFLEKVGIDGK